jgi:hypothetical protein
MVVTGCIDFPYREVESADARQDSYKTAQSWPDSIGEFRVTLMEHYVGVASSSPAKLSSLRTFCFPRRPTPQDTAP